MLFLAEAVYVMLNIGSDDLANATLCQSWKGKDDLLKNFPLVLWMHTHRSWYSTTEITVTRSSPGAITAEAMLVPLGIELSEQWLSSYGWNSIPREPHLAPALLTFRCEDGAISVNFETLLSYSPAYMDPFRAVLLFSLMTYFILMGFALCGQLGIHLSNQLIYRVCSLPSPLQKTTQIQLL